MDRYIDEEEYKKWRNHVDELKNNTKKNYILRQVKNCNNDSKKIWQVANNHVKIKNQKSNVPEFIINNQKEKITDIDEMAENFKNFYLQFN